MDYVRLPKVVLHDHLDGGLRPASIVELAAAHGYHDLPEADPERLAAWFHQGEAGSLERYLEAFVHTVAVMQTGQALERIAYEAVLDLAADGVVYAELRFAPTLHLAGGLRPREVVEAVLAGARRGEEETGLVTRILLTALRDQEDSEQVAALAVALRGTGVVGFDLAGPERGHPPDLHLPACRAVRQAGLGLTIHAGEGDGPHSIWRALVLCGADRIGHGYRIAEDARLGSGRLESAGRLASVVRDRRVPLEICPTSNLHTAGMAPGDHPLGALHRAGFTVTLNTDNRLMSATSMSGEFRLAVEHHGFEAPDLLAVTTAALEAAFCDLPTRRQLLEERVRPGYAALLD